ncbi:DUF488 family protein [Thermodesulfobacterium hydrogeniphilum]|uniref:DUF488 family protein n=1 Tax=Thermodesulfobacterium hydrogeniphilum TaxID=161156 RepID=UPI0012EB3248
MTWNKYEKNFNKELQINFDETCLLCSKDNPDRCHRRLIAEFLKKIFLNKSLYRTGYKALGVKSALHLSNVFSKAKIYLYWIFSCKAG